MSKLTEDLNFIKTVMTDQLISSITAKIAEEKGFDFSIVPYRDSNTFELALNVEARLEYCSVFENPVKEANLIKLPTQSYLQRWLREKHNIHVEPYKTLCDTVTGEGYGCQGEDWRDEGTVDLFNFYAESYEDALEKGLQEALNHISIAFDPQ